MTSATKSESLCENCINYMQASVCVHIYVCVYTYIEKDWEKLPQHDSYTILY